jgi:serine/threonine-protein kinase RsbW
MFSSSPPTAFLDMIKTRFNQITQNGTMDDDVTAIVAEVLTQSRKNQIKEKLAFKSDDPVYLQTLNYYEEIDRAIAVILSTMDAYGYLDDHIRKMKVVLSELLVNAILHGNKRDFSKKVTIGHIVDKKTARISILDEGNGFDPSKVPDPTLPENLARDCGRGLYIAYHYVDQILFNEKGNRVTVIKKHEMNNK